MHTEVFPIVKPVIEIYGYKRRARIPLRASEMGRKAPKIENEYKSKHPRIIIDSRASESVIDITI
jgi:hypothetical protein